MQSPRSVVRAAWRVLLSTALAEPALGANLTCEAVMVSADPAVDERWPDLHERVRRGLSGRSDIDRCARVHLGANGDGVTLQVTLEDGRSATRSVPGSEDVVPGLEALLLLPSPEATSAVLKPRATKRPAKQPRHGQAPTAVRDAGLAPEVVDDDSGVGVALSFGGGARTGDGQVNSNLGAMAFVSVSDWLMGFDGRAVSYEVPRSGRIPQPALELTAVGGRRFGSGTFGVDLLLGPTLVLQQDVAVHEESAGRVSHTTTSRVLPRLFAAGRLTIGARSVLSGFVGIEAAAGPSGASDVDAVAALPPLPVWMLGFVVGATVGVP